MVLTVIGSGLKLPSLQTFGRRRVSRSNTRNYFFGGGGGFHDQFLETIVLGGRGGVGRLLEHWRSSKTADMAKMEDLDNCRRKFGGKSINQSRVY